MMNGTLGIKCDKDVSHLEYYLISILMSNI